ncbi:MAG: hypothetical protein AABX83_01650 [Nanoarchaeota archaeon]
MSREKKIEYWSKHQDLDKFNYGVNLDSRNKTTLFLASFFIPLILSGISLIVDEKYLIGFILVLFSSLFFPIFVWIFTGESSKELRKAKENFRIREAMLRVWYQKWVDTDLLDTQHELIKEMSKKGISENKQLELIAKKVIEDTTTTKKS